MAKASDNQFPKVTFAESAAPATPSSGLGFLYEKTDGKPYFKNDAGTEYDLAAAATGIAATIVDAKGDLIAATAADTVARLAVGATNGMVLKVASGETTGLQYALLEGGVSLVILNPATGVAADLEMPCSGVITAATVLLNASGSIVFDLWKDTYANYPPTVADTITASAKPTVSAATKSQDTTLTGWTTTFAKGDIIRVNIDSVATATRATLALRYNRTS